MADGDISKTAIGLIHGGDDRFHPDCGWKRSRNLVAHVHGMHETVHVAQDVALHSMGHVGERQTGFRKRLLETLG
ncbi:MAG: hypothetical protein ABR543_17675 [Gemmatimonadaceae bacterium]